MTIRKSYPRLGSPITLTVNTPAVFIHAITRREEPGHVLPAGAVIRQEIHTPNLPASREIFQWTHDGAMGRFWVDSAAIPPEAERTR